MEGLVVFMVAAVLVEVAWDNIKGALPFDPSDRMDRAVVIALCVFVTVTARLDLPGYYNLVLHPVVAYIVSGLVISRGANVFHDIAKKLQAGKEGV